MNTERHSSLSNLLTAPIKPFNDSHTFLRRRIGGVVRNSDIKDGIYEFGDKLIYLERSFAQENEPRMHQICDVITVHTCDVATSCYN